MKPDTLLAMLALEIGQLRGTLLGSKAFLSPETITATENSIQQLSELLESMRAKPSVVRTEQIQAAIHLAVDQRNLIRKRAEGARDARGQPRIEPLAVPVVDHRTPPGCLVSVITFVLGVLATIHLPFIGWFVGPFVIIGILFHPGTPMYYCANCTTELTYKTVKVCPGCGAEFTGVERRGSGNKYGVWMLILLAIFFVVGVVL